MSALSELAEYIARVAGERGGAALDKTGAEFMAGAARPGTFQQGREFANTPEGLAAQFNWSVPDYPVGGGHMRTLNPNSPDSAAWLFKQDPNDFKAMAAYKNGQNGVAPYLDQLLGHPGSVYVMDTGNLSAGTGEGKRAYPALYGNVLNEPEALNVKDALTPVNAWRNNYNLSSAIMRQPNAGERLLASPSQFNHLGDVMAPQIGQWAGMGPERQVGAMQTEGALEAMRRLAQAAGNVNNPVLRARLLAAPSSDPLALSRQFSAVQAARMAPENKALLQSLGPAALKKLGIVSDTAQGLPVNPAVYQQLEFRQGGLAQASASSKGALA